MIILTPGAVHARRASRPSGAASRRRASTRRPRPPSRRPPPASPPPSPARAPVYGVNTGFGKLASVKIAAGDTATLQRNLILSHCSGVGDADARGRSSG